MYVLLAVTFPLSVTISEPFPVVWILDTVTVDEGVPFIPTIKLVAVAVAAARVPVGSATTIEAALYEPTVEFELTAAALAADAAVTVPKLEPSKDPRVKSEMLIAAVEPPDPVWKERLWPKRDVLPPWKIVRLLIWPIS